MQQSIPASRGRARVGVVVPVSNSNLEPDMMLLAPPGVSVHFARTGGYDVDAIPDAEQMRQYSDAHPDEIVDQLRLCGADIILYGCTSATLAQGPAYDAEFRRNIEQRSGLPVISAASALVEALRSAGAGKFALTSPYVASLNDLAIDFIEQQGFECVGRCDTAEPWSNQRVGAEPPETALAMALQADCPQADAIVISCTDFRAVEAISEIEARAGKPVISSNQALMALALARLGIDFDGSPLRAQRLASHLRIEAG